MENYTFKDSFLGGYNKKEVEDYMSRLQSDMDTERARFRAIEEENKNLLEQRKEIETHYRDLWQQYEEASAENEKLNLKVQLHDKETENFQVQIKKLNDANNFLRKQLVKGQTGQDDDMEYRSAGSVPYERREAGYQTELLRTASAGYRDGGTYDREQSAGVNSDAAVQERETLSPRSQSYATPEEAPSAYTRQEAPGDLSSAQPQEAAAAYAQQVSQRETAAAYAKQMPQRDASAGYAQQVPRSDAAAYAQRISRQEVPAAYAQQMPQRDVSAGYAQQMPRQDEPFARTAQTAPRDLGSPQAQRVVPDDVPLPYTQQTSARDTSPAYAREVGIRADAEFSTDDMPMPDDLGEDLNTYMDSAAAGLHQQAHEVQEKASALTRSVETAAGEAADDFPLQMPPAHKRTAGKSSGSKYMKQLREIAKKVNVKL